MNRVTSETRRSPRRLGLLPPVPVVVTAFLLVVGGAPAAAAPAEDRPQPPLQHELEESDAAPSAAARSAARTAARTGPSRLPRGGSRIFPRYRMVSLYGAPQLTRTILGRRSVEGATKKLRRQVRAYRRLRDGPVVRGIHLIATIATADAGADGRYRFRQSDDLIKSYLRAARSVNARLVLDIQSGRSSFLTEAKALRKWLRKPDVDLALDPEWNVGRSGVPGQTAGKVGYRMVNKVSGYMARLGRRHDLPQKTLVVHQFNESMVRGRESIRQRGRKVAVTLNFDGIGSPPAKRSGYKALSEPGLFDGFSLFYELDSPLMKPKRVIRLRPKADYVMYQ